MTDYLILFTISGVGFMEGILKARFRQHHTATELSLSAPPGASSQVRRGLPSKLSMVVHLKPSLAQKRHHPSDCTRIAALQWP